MKKTFLTIALAMLVLSSFAQKKILFDNTKSETAGNADWIIDDNQPIPSPAQSGITQSTTEDYWQGALSSWGVEMVKRGYSVETLPNTGSITYNDASNSQDLSNYDIFVVCEPNNPFTSSEKQAIINFVQNGGGLFIVSDHEIADRDGDGWDALDVWNDFFSSYNNPFGFTLDANSNVSKDPATNVANLPSNKILHGAAGDVDGLAFYNGATFTIDKNTNSSVTGLVYYDGFSNTGTTGVMAVCATYGNGRVVGVGDSSVAEDETAHDASTTYPGWYQPFNAGDATGDDGVFMTNATLWLGESSNDVEILNEDFATCPPANWINYSVASNHDWSCNNETMTINGYGGDVASDDWLISPAMDFSGYSSIILNFDTWTKYGDNGITDPEVSVKYSLDYPGSGNPESYTWTELTYNFPAEHSQTWTNSGDIDLSTISGAAVYLAFQYTSSGTASGSSSSWEVDNVTIVGQATNTKYTISASVNPANSGSITGSGSYNDGDTVTLTAIANTGYTFTNWTENENVVSTSATYQFTATTSRTLVANFTASGNDDNETELLTNPDFTSGLDGWWAYGADLSVNNGEVIFNINDGGLNPWDIQLGQGNLTLKKGYKYTLCWRAKRESGSISFNVGLGAEPYTLYFNDTPSGFDGNWQENCIEYVHQNEDVSNVALTINMGQSTANATFDYVYLKEDPNYKVDVTYSVDMSHQTVSPDGVFIEGSFNNWASPVEMQQVGNIYSTVLKLPHGESVEYHFLNGSIPESVSGDCTTGNNNNRYLLVPDQSTTLDVVCFNSCTYCIDSTLFKTNPGAGPVSFYGEMQVKGNRIYGKRTGTPVQVKGMSLFGSLWGGEKFWNSGAIHALVDNWDIELIRAPMPVEENFQWGYGYLNPMGRNKQLYFVDNVVKAAIARDIYVLIDYHSFTADEHLENALEFFSTVAKKYGQYDNVIFEIYNEPVVASWAKVKLYAEQVTDAIRQYSDNLIVVGTEFYSSKPDIASLSPLSDSNTAYVFHFYSIPDMDNVLQRPLDALNNGVALFTTEWGNIYTWGDNLNHSDSISFANSDKLNILMDQNSISSANWSVYVDDYKTGAALFYDEDGLNGDISFTGENWNDTTKCTDSGHYVYNWLKEQAATAPWRKAERQGYSIAYHLNGGYNGANPAFYSSNLTEAIVLDEPVKKDFLFEGWYTNSNFLGEPVTQINAGSNGDREYYAKWAVPEELELLSYPNFKYGPYGWTHYGDNDSVFAENEQLTLLDLTDNSGDLGTYYFFNNNSFSLKKGHRYTLNWKAVRASGEISITVHTNNPYTIHFSDKKTFNGEWQEDTLVYDHTGETVQGAELLVYVGGDTSDVTFDHISLTESLIPAPESYSISAAASPTEAGEVSGAGTYEDGETVTLTATANSGYTFTNWTENGNLVSTSATYTFTATEDRSLVANFDNISGISTNTTSSSQVQVFPNPSNHYINVSGLPDHENLEITIVNMYGVEIGKYMSNNKSTLIFDLSDYSDGVYFIKINGSGKNETFKIIHNSTR